MRVLFFISCRGHGSGGHFHSLNHIAAAIGKKIEVGIYSIGPGISDVISKNQFFKGHLPFNGKNFFTLKKQINELLKNHNPDIIHCFDNSAYNILSLIVNSKYRIVVNKCGGPNPIEFPFVQNLILFSKENEKWFKQQPKFQKSSIYTIPNRVNKKELVFDNSLNLLTKPDKFCFVRIARIGETYQKSIEDSIRLIEQIKNIGLLNVQLFIIGVEEDKSILSDLKQLSQRLPVTYITEDEYTKKASNMLYLADAVIATGRGVMEATGLGKPILTPAQNSELPILVTKNNFDEFLATNFSQRNVVNNSDLRSNFANIRKLIENKHYYDTLRNESRDIFNKHFDVQGAVIKYIELYNIIIKESTPRKSTFRNLKYQLKTIYSFLK